MNYVEKLDKAIFYCLCAFGLTSCVSGTIADQFIGLGVLLGIIRSIIKRPKVQISQGYLRAFMVFFGVLFILIFVSEDMGRSAREYWRFFNRMFPFLLALLFISRRKQILWIGVCLLISVTINNGYAIYKQIIVFNAQATWIRASGFDNYIINLAGILLLTIPSLSILIFSDEVQSIKKRYLVLLLIFSCFTLFMNGTRIALVIIAFILLVLPFFLNNSRKAAIYSCLGLLIGIILISTLATSSLYNRQISNQAHYLIAKDSLQMIGDHPVLGVGLGRFPKVFNETYISSQTKAVEGFIPHAHNNTLHMLAETGIVGVAVFWYLFGSFLVFSWKDWRRYSSLSALMFFAATLAIMLQGITDYSFGLHPVMKLYFLMLAMYLRYQKSDESYLKAT